MIELYLRGLFHFLSSGLVGLLAWALMYSAYSPVSISDRFGSTDSTFWSQLRIPVLLAVWTHIVVDVFEHGHLPYVVSGVTELVRSLPF